jgi:hypothetical protein
MYSHYLEYRGHRIQIKSLPTLYKIQRAQDSGDVMGDPLMDFILRKSNTGNNLGRGNSLQFKYNSHIIVLL